MIRARGSARPGSDLQNRPGALLNSVQHLMQQKSGLIWVFDQPFEGWKNRVWAPPADLRSGQMERSMRLLTELKARSRIIKDSGNHGGFAVGYGAQPAKSRLWWAAWRGWWGCPRRHVSRDGWVSRRRSWWIPRRWVTRGSISRRQIPRRAISRSRVFLRRIVRISLVELLPGLWVLRLHPALLPADLVLLLRSCRLLSYVMQFKYRLGNGSG